MVFQSLDSDEVYFNNDSNNNNIIINNKY